MFLRGNRDDWIAFQRLVGNEVGVSEFTQMQESVAFGLPALSEYREYRPPQEWHEKADGVLAPAWNDGEIQALAERTRAKDREIQLVMARFSLARAIAIVGMPRAIGKLLKMGMAS
ncbi:hypothetical protein A9X01_14715 [Mycobacterium asiaticum]|uniref:Uncharacterized protein n=1 Tax=Mycobacterium asiaticum TaxID=1790 RepID=A0A1A3CQK4_MYCAS|nr:hypothetical protein A9X01_14715 [Mycobacterium asiaticum]